MLPNGQAHTTLPGLAQPGCFPHLLVRLLSPLPATNAACRISSGRRSGRLTRTKQSALNIPNTELCPKQTHTTLLLTCTEVPYYHSFLHTSIKQYLRRHLWTPPHSLPQHSSCLSTREGWMILQILTHFGKPSCKASQVIGGHEALPKMGGIFPNSSICPHHCFHGT